MWREKKAERQEMRGSREKRQRKQWKCEEEEEETWGCFTAPGGGWSLAAVAAAAHPPAEEHAGGPPPGGQWGPSEGLQRRCEAAGPDTQCWGRPTTTGWASQRCLKGQHTQKKSLQKSDDEVKKFSNSFVQDGPALCM